MSGEPEDYYDNYYDKYYGTESEPYKVTYIESAFVNRRNPPGTRAFIIYYRTYKKRVRNIVWAIDEMGAFVEAIRLLDGLKAKSDYAKAKKQGANQ